MPKAKPAHLILLLAVTIAWLSWPIYDFYAHRGKVPFLPFTETLTLPDSSPIQQTLYNSRYEPAASQALIAMKETSDKIQAPAISAAVAIEGKLVWAGASGWADLATQTPVTTKTRFRIGSTSKALTSVTLARMVDLGLIDIDKSISHHLSPIPNVKWNDMTPRMLASHTSGLPHYKQNTEILGLYKSLALQTLYSDVEDALKLFDSSDLLFEPGNEFSYSSYGTVLLSAVMQRAGHKPFLELVHDLVLTPLALKETEAEYKIDNKGTLATFYWNDKGRSDHLRAWRDVDLSHRLAGGGFVSSPSDLARLGAGVTDERFVKPETRQNFWTPKPLPDGSMPPHNYSVGWRVIDVDLGPAIGEVKVINHGGVSRGSQSWLMILPEYRMSVAVNINSNTKVFWDFAGVSTDIARAFILANSTSTSESKE